MYNFDFIIVSRRYYIIKIHIYNNSVNFFTDFFFFYPEWRQGEGFCGLKSTGERCYGVMEKGCRARSRMPRDLAITRP